MKVYNHDIVSMISRIGRFMQELHKSVSANLSELSTADKNRLKSYLASITTFKSWVVAQPELDLPESSPKEYNLEDLPAFAEIENLDVTAVMRLLQSLVEEMANSQSARKPAGLTVHDSYRFDTIVAKINSFLADFIEQDGATGLDLPESSPKSPMSGAGNTGV